MKNTKAIEKIISELALKDYLMANSKKKKNSKNRPYILSEETIEAKDVYLKYLKDEISEYEYKSYCLKYNLRSE